MRTLSKTQYLHLATQCEARAGSAKSEAERQEYRRKAHVWHRLADARLPGTSEGPFRSTRGFKKALLRECEVVSLSAGQNGGVANDFRQRCAALAYRHSAPDYSFARIV